MSRSNSNYGAFPRKAHSFLGKPFPATPGFSIPSIDAMLASGRLSAELELELTSSPEVEAVPCYIGGESPSADGRTDRTGPAADTERPICNTPPTNHHAINVPGATHAAGGLDWLEWCSYGEWNKASFKTLGEALDKARDDGQRADQDQVIELAGYPVRVLRSGVRRGLYCRWCFEVEGIEIAIVNSSESKPNMFNVHAIARSTACMELGQGVYSKVLFILEKLGYTEKRTVVSRVDLAVDLVGVPVSEFVKAFNEGKIVRRARTGTVHFEGKRHTGLTLGKKNVMLRCYDKLWEMTVHPDSIKQEVLQERRWNAERPKCASRVEFQLRRDVLRAMSLDDVRQTLGNLAAAVKWLMEDWCRFTHSVPSRNHQERCEASALWKGIQAVLVDAFQTGSAVPLNWKRKLSADPVRLLQQAMGCIGSALSLTIQTLPETVNEVRDAVYWMIEPGLHGLVEAVNVKRLLVETKAALQRVASFPGPQKGYHPENALALN